MNAVSQKLSSLKSQLLSNRSDNLEFKQFYRSYSGEYKINFPLCFKNYTDSKTINYSNFYLTNNTLLEDICNVPSTRFKSSTIITKIKHSSDYLKFSNIDPATYRLSNNFRENYNYGVGVFNTESEDYFHISFLDFNKCNIYYKRNNIDYYLAVDDQNSVVFVNKIKLQFNESYINPQDFIYMFSESEKNILFFKKNELGNFILIKQNGLLKMVGNIVDYVNVPFTIDRNIYTYPDMSLNTSFITYSNINTVDIEKTELDLSNNFLIHKKPTDNTNNTNLIFLKNQLSQLGVFTCSNNLLSGVDIPVNNFREYTSIFQDVTVEKSNDLKLNYVFFNKTYKIDPGVTKFESPVSMYPFNKLNINDSTLTKSGAFSFTTPQYADKIFKISDNIVEKNNNQHLLCTWLSGHPNSTEKVWVDRYYYPDVISKESALASPSYEYTYDEYIENLIASNSTLQSKIEITKFFDKKSDFCFQPAENYEYHRIEEVPILISNILPPPCNTVYPLNYFKNINETGKFTLLFNFSGDSIWIIESDRNDIESRISIEKTPTNIIFNYTIYNSTYNIFESYECNTPIKPLNVNMLCVSVDATKGYGYVFINNEVVYSFSLTPYKYLRSQLLYGDIFLYLGENKTNLLYVNDNVIDNVLLSYDYLDSSYLYLKSILQSNTINTIYISLPCGMRNDIDDICILNDICISSTFKSNNINIIVKNIEEIQGLDNFLVENLQDSTPITTEISDIIYKNYKNI